MNVLTLTTKEQVENYSRDSYKLTKEGKYDKVVFKGISDLSAVYLCYGSYDPGYLNFVPEIEVQNCTVDHKYISIYHVKTPLKITIKDSDIMGITIRDVCTSISVELDNVTGPHYGSYYSIEPDSGGTYTGDKSSLTIKNSSRLMIYEFKTNPSICNVELSNNHDMSVAEFPVKYIPNNTSEQSAFVSQFSFLQAAVTPSKIDEFNYQFDQSDWDKLISLLDRYPDIFKYIKFDDQFISFLQPINISDLPTNDVYIHIPSTTFPLDWVARLDYNTTHDFNNSRTMVVKDYTWFYVNKNNGHNFTITHIDKMTSWGMQKYLQGLLIADNYKDIIAAQPDTDVSTSSGSLNAYYPKISFINILSGKMVTTEITLLANTYSLIRTVGSDMKIKRIKEVTGFYGKTVKVTGMEPLMILSVAGTTCRDIDGMIEVNRPKSEAFIDGSITVKRLFMADIDGNTTIQQKAYAIITGSVAVNPIESFIDGDVSIKAIQKSIMDGIIPVEVPTQEVDIDGAVIVAGIEKFITGTVNVHPIVSITVTGEIAVNLIDYDLDGSFQLAQAVSADIIGDIDVRVCRVEILGYFEIPMEEVWG